MFPKLITFTIILILCNQSTGDLTDYFNDVKSLFWSTQDVSTELEDDYSIHVPYEVSSTDEKFISEAAQLTGVALSQLDSCQHAVVLKLKTDCDKMNDEMVAKMAVALLNCQSMVEGRKMYPCTPAMGIKDCTTSMDADTWNTYHLMTNRVKAVCYSIRQIHFRGLTEHTINKLMETSQNQLKSLGQISRQQESLKDMAEETMDTLEKRNVDLMEQQKDLHKAQLFGQLAIEDNINRLVDEKKMIAESQNELNQLTQQMRGKLNEAAEELQSQANERSENHKELVDDLLAIQNQANVIFQRIETAAQLLHDQTVATQRHYTDTLAQLTAVNRTILSVITLVAETRDSLEERLSWLTETLGGTNLSLARLQTVAGHVALLLAGMVLCAFLGVTWWTRVLLVVAVPGNMLLGVWLEEGGGDDGGLESLGVVELAGSVLAAGIVLNIFTLLTCHLLSPRSSQLTPKPLKDTDNTTPAPSRQSSTHTVENTTSSHTGHLLQHPRLSQIHETTEDHFDGASGSHYDEDVFAQPTPPHSRNSHYRQSPELTSARLAEMYGGGRGRSRSKTPSVYGGEVNVCQGVTRHGTPCKSKASKQGNYCYRHDNGDSILQ